MIEPGVSLVLAMALAGLSAAAFYPMLVRGPVGRRSAVFEALLKGRKSEGAATATRSVRRAQEAALRSIGQQYAARRDASGLAGRLAAAGLDWSAHHYWALCFGI